MTTDATPASPVEYAFIEAGSGRCVVTIFDDTPFPESCRVARASLTEPGIVIHLDERTIVLSDFDEASRPALMAALARKICDVARISVSDGVMVEAVPLVECDR